MYYVGLAIAVHALVNILISERQTPRHVIAYWIVAGFVAGTFVCKGFNRLKEHLERQKHSYPYPGTKPTGDS